jgi:hypothetical protein
MRIFLLFLLPAVAGAQIVEADRYSEIHQLIGDAESAMAHADLSKFRPNPYQSTARLYAIAGYWKDATRLAAKAGPTSPYLNGVRIQNGNVDEALRQTATITDLDDRIRRFCADAYSLWLMGDRTNAARAIQQAEHTAAVIPDPSHRAAQLRVIASQKVEFQRQPPLPLSSTERAIRRRDPPASSSLPLFPVTAEGFRNRSGEVLAQAAQENGVYLTRLYALAETTDGDSLRKHLDSAYSPFQKTLGLATIEHLLLQHGQIQAAENIANTIPDDGADCSLAKGEALTAAGVAWTHKEESERARLAFEAALRNIRGVNQDLAFGKVKVLAALAGAQTDAGFVVSAKDTLELAWKVAAALPAIPRPFLQHISARAPKPIFRHDGYRVIFDAAVRTHDLGAARRTVELWKQSDRESDVSIVSAWLSVEQPEEAIAYVRSLKNAKDRAEALLVLIERLLARAGAQIL